MPAASCYAPPRALYFALSCAPFPTRTRDETGGRHPLDPRLEGHAARCGTWLDEDEGAFWFFSLPLIRPIFFPLSPRFLPLLLPSLSLSLSVSRSSSTSVKAWPSYFHIWSARFAAQPRNIEFHGRIRDTCEITCLIASTLDAIKQGSPVSTGIRTSAQRIFLIAYQYCSGSVIRNGSGGAGIYEEIEWLKRGRWILVFVFQSNFIRNA